MNVSRTTDVDFIVRCVLENWDAASDDNCGDPDFYFPPMYDGITWYRVDDWGVYCLEKKADRLYECHTVLLRTAKGKAVAITKEALQWAWLNTDAERIITSVPAFNQLALRLALKCGFTQYETKPKSFQKNGIFYDQILLEIRKDSPCQY